MLELGVNKLNLNIDAGWAMRKYGWKTARTPEQRIQGVTEIIPKGAAAAATVVAADGDANNPEPATAEE